MISSRGEPISYWNREKKKLEVEQVYGDLAVRLLYGTRLGRKLTHRFLVRPWVSRLYGSFQSSSLSRKKIRPFIKQFDIPMNEFEERDYPSFNEFFIRRFRPGARVFPGNSEVLPAFAEGRYLAYSRVEPRQEFPVKGKYMTAAAILGSGERASVFENGPVFIARLCPTDYHRFHFPDDGWYLESYRRGGGLHSVNPIALRSRADIFATNERQISILQTKNFGCLAYVEIGALCVGRIVQTHPVDRNFKRGDEKGYFYFGGSTIMLFGEPDRWQPDADLLHNTAKGLETLVKLGEGIAKSRSMEAQSSTPQSNASQSSETPSNSHG